MTSCLLLHKIAALASFAKRCLGKNAQSRHVQKLLSQANCTVKCLFAWKDRHRAAAQCHKENGQEKEETEEWYDQGMLLELLSLVKILMNGPPQRGQGYMSAVSANIHVRRGVNMMVLVSALLPFVGGLFRVSGGAVRGSPATRGLHPSRAHARQASRAT